MKKRFLLITMLILSAMLSFSACKGSNDTESSGGENSSIINTDSSSEKKDSSTKEESSVEEDSVYTVVYKVEDGEDKVLTLDVGTQPSDGQIPAVGTKTGYDLAWSVTDFSGAQANEVITVTVVYTPKQYTVSYDANGGVEISNATTVTYHAPYFLETPVREGYTFVAWQDSEGKDVALSGDAWRVAGDMSLTATWRQNEPDVCSVIFMQEGKENVMLSVNSGEDLDESLIPAIEEREGFTAIWSVRGEPANFTGITSSMTVTPAYTPKSYQISFNSNGGTEITDVVTVTYGEAYDFSDKAPEKSGLYFVNGWYFGDVNVSQTGIWSLDCDATATLEAKYSVQVTFKQNGFEDKTVYYLQGSNVTESQLPETSPKAGYVVKWEKDVLQKLSNLQANVTIYAVEQSLAWSPVV